VSKDVAEEELTKWKANEELITYEATFVRP